MYNTLNLEVNPKLMFHPAVFKLGLTYMSIREYANIHLLPLKKANIHLLTGHSR